MQSVDVGNAVPGESHAHTQLLVESKGRPAPSTVTRFLRAARHLAATRTRTGVFLVDDGVDYAVDDQGEVAGILDAGGHVWADKASLFERGIKADELTPGVVVADLDVIVEQLFDPDVRVVWH